MKIDFNDFYKTKPSQNQIDSVFNGKKPNLEKIFKKEKFEKIYLINEIGDNGDKKYLKLLNNLLEKEGDLEVKNEIIFNLGKLDDSKAVKKLINILLSSTNYRLRERAILILANMKPHREILHAFEHILAYDQDTRLRVKSVEALSKLKSYLTIFTLEKIFLEEKNQEIKKIIIKTLPKIEAEEAREFLLSHLLKEKETDLIKEIIWSLSYLVKKPEHFRELLENFLELPMEVQKILVFALARIENDSASSELAKLLTKKDLDKNIAIEIIELCGRYKIKKALPVIIKMIKTRDRGVKKKALWAIVNLRAKKAIPAIKKRLKRERDPEIRDELKKALNYLMIFT